jgi:aspartate carbamoyltransferase catalytic subunit
LLAMNTEIGYNQDMQHILTTQQFLDKKTLKKIFTIAAKLEKQNKNGKVPPVLKGKILATLFYEPSTRTRFSFETAMLKLGGQIITTENARDFSSTIKGETIEDTVRVVGGYADAIVLRHPENGSAARAAAASPVPIINAGDGSGEHPTQALLDLYTIQKELGRMHNLKIALVGDLLYGRTVHSLIILLSIFKNIEIYLISPKELRLPEEYRKMLRSRKIKFIEGEYLEKILPQADVLYVTRIQKERFASLGLYNKVKDSFSIDKDTLKKLPKKSIVMHPLPRVHEISPEVDQDRRVAYFRQAKNGLYVRMALLQICMGKK